MRTQEDPTSIRATPDPAQWQHVKQLLADALELPAADRPDFVARVAAQDRARAVELQSLLDAAAVTHSWLDELPATLERALEEATGDARIGQRLGPYRITALLGRGGMGLVYRAERADGQYEQQVAVKVMRDSYDREHAITRFRAERQILASLDHPNLAKVFDGGVTDDGHPYFVMELVDGEPITEHAERRRLNIEQRLQLFRTVCQVTHYAHRKGVVHRDLKPSNILVTDDGTVKLLDFGVAKRIAAAEGGPASVTRTADRVLTLAYASPEQVLGGDITPASDIYSLGIVLYRLLTGVSPYQEVQPDSEYQLIKAICDDEPPLPSRRQGNGRRLRGDLDAVVMMALRKEPERRYRSAEQLADDLFRYLERLPVQARRGAWGYRAGRLVLRHRGLLGATMLVLMAGVAVSSWQAYEAHQQRQRAERHLADVRQLANVFIFDLHDAIRDLRGSTSLRKQMVEQALAYLQKLSSEAGGDARLAVEIASGYRKVGDAQGSATLFNLGDPTGAMSSYDKAIALLQPVVASPGDRNAGYRAAQWELARVHGSRGELLGFLGKIQEADAELRKGLAMADDLLRAQPSDEHRVLLALLYDKQSELQWYSGALEAYVKTSDSAIQLLEGVVARAPDDVPATKHLAGAYQARGRYLATRDDPRQAITYFHKCLSLLERLHANRPDDAGIAYNIANTHGDLAITSQLSGDARQAVQEGRKAVARFASLIAKDPNDVLAKAGQLGAHTHLSEALLAQGDVTGSIATARAALSLIEGLPTEARRDVGVRQGLGEAHYHLAKALEASAESPSRSAAASTGDHREACASYDQALLILQELKDDASIEPGDLGPDAVREAMRACSLRPAASRRK